ncbi:MAG: Eco57I restriction-modification methylase domain-containing protein [Phycisphaeraceae bacterium]|nr:Eco57I restriction-modification methylase domain-containing protein [Phycisphaeraceae bacterium]
MDLARCRKLLDALDLDTLFVECLGWDRHKASLTVATKSGEVVLKGFAEKRGFAAFLCDAGSDGRIPDHAARAIIDREVTKCAREHIIVYTNKQRTEQVWQWVRRGHGTDGQRQPLKRREFNWRSGQTSAHLVERVLPSICFTLAEEETLTLPEVTSRASAAFDVEKVTKKFFERFKAEHEAFHKFIDGIAGASGVADKDWYASVMLNRLMFCYFIQKKGLLDGDHDYLRNRLGKLQSAKGPTGGKDKFWSFYRQFLLKLFHEGLSTKTPRGKELDALIGKIPYLNGGLFDVHELETRHKDIKIPDSAFERLFKFFDEYTWHLDDRPLTQGNEINPDVLGYIFEKYINQKQMGAYYTKEDITEYISKNTIIPFILDQAVKNCAIAFKPTESGSVWRLLKNDPDRYIYDAVLHGVIDDQGKVITLPAEVEAGVKDVSKRGGWNKPASAPFALPTETWREHVARRQRCLELREKLAKGEVTAVNDLVTLNLDIRQFAEDVIVNAEGPDLLRAVWKAVESVTVLDPTCGSGAFLFAALNILEPLYEACLDRMESFLDDLKRAEAAGEKVHADKFKDFKGVITEVNDPNKHASTRYFILKSIIVNNLYGVDIMEEACEICKLRLFLKLVAQIEEGVGGIDKIEPLPDIDFNIRAGNTLVGFTSLASIEKAAPTFLASVNFVDAIKERAEQAATAFRLFREMQTKQGVGSKELAEGKKLVREKLNTLHEELDRYLASEYEVSPDKPKLFAEWRKSHEPFHWFVDFYAIMASGGFDVIIGNPPYVEVSKLKGYSVRGLRTAKCKDIYAWLVERCCSLRAKNSRIGLIIPISVAASGSFDSLRKLLLADARPIWMSHFANRPGQLFTGAQNRLTILMQGPEAAQQRVWSSKYYRWDAKGGERDALLALVTHADVTQQISRFHGLIPKASTTDHLEFLNALSQRAAVRTSIAKNGRQSVYWVRVPGYFCQFFLSPPKARPEGGGPSQIRGEVNDVAFANERRRRVAFTVLNSTAYYLFFATYTDGRHINPSDVSDAPFDLDAIEASVGQALELLAGKLEERMREATGTWRKSGLLIDSVDSVKYIDILHEIDDSLATALGLSPSAVDAMKHYDHKYRIGKSEEVEE